MPCFWLTKVIEALQNAIMHLHIIPPGLLMLQPLANAWHAMMMGGFDGGSLTVV